MKELIEALTRAANAVAFYYEKEAGMTGKDVTGPVAEPKATRTRKPKEDAVDAKLEAAPEAKVESKEPTAAEVAKSKTEIYEVTTQYVHRFKTATPDGKARALAILATDYKVPGLANLTEHKDRVSYIAKLKTEMAAA